MFQLLFIRPLLKPNSIGCFGEEVPYTNSVADIRSKLTFETSHTVNVDWWRNYDISYRAFLVVQTYDTNVVSDLNKTFVVTAAVFPEEISRIDIVDDYNFINTSRQFMKSVQ